MALILKQSTAVDVLIGPFVDSTDGYTAKTGVSPSVKLSKNGQTLGAKNDATTPVHDADGYYNCELDATDTNTVGTLVLTVVGSATSLPVRHEYQVVEEATYDFLYASGATPLADVNAECDTALGDYDAPTKAELDSGFAGQNDLSAADVRSAVGLASADLDTQLDALPTAAENATAVLTTQMTESYASNGTAPTAAQALFAIHQMLMHFGIAGTSLTVKQLDNSTTAFVVTLDDDTAPTAASRT